MFTKNYRYWLCQAGGWAALFLTYTFFYITLIKKDIPNFYLFLFFQVALGLVISHFMRLVIREFKFLQKHITEQIIYFLLTTVIFAGIYGIVTVTIERGINSSTGLPAPKDSFILQAGRESFSNLFILIIWNFIYFVYHYYERNRRQDLDTLRLQALVKELELATIKSHINPHFIFNALNSIRALVDENPQRARTAITELSNILRSSMQVEKLETVPLQKELNIVKDYLALEEMRFEERLNVTMQIDEETINQPVPPMMLQTLVENAIKHGISKHIDGGHIKIISSYSGNSYELTVQNSGQLNGNINGDGFGIQSTQDRLNLLYQGKANFQIRNMDSNTVESKVTMPQVKSDELQKFAVQSLLS
ncbi:MAG: histidine kinase [Chitinophagaceae bacterium]